MPAIISSSPEIPDAKATEKMTMNVSPSVLPPPPPPPPPPGCIPPPLPNAGTPTFSRISRGPTPSTPMKRLQWDKIPEVKVKNTVNFWTVASKMCSSVKVNFEKVEELFSCKTANNVNHNINIWNVNSGNLSRSDSPHQSAFIAYRKDVDCVDGSSQRTDSPSGNWERRKKCEEVNLLDAKRSMNVNIFLRQLRISNQELVEKIKRCDTEAFDIEILKTLARLLPDEADKSALNSYKGDIDRLGNAEKFYLVLMSLANFDLIIQTMLLKEEFFQALDTIKPAIDAVIVCSRGIKNSKAFHEVIYLVLMVGNFLNSGAYSGDAAGFKLCSLLKVTDIKANDNKLHLMHYVAQEADSKDPTIAEQLEKLRDQSSASLNNTTVLMSDIRKLRDGVMENISKLLLSETTQQDTSRHLKSIQHTVTKEMTMLETEAIEVESLRLELARYFCEDETSFRLDECLNIVNNFCKRFLLAHEENKELRLQAEKAELKRREISSRRSLKTGASPNHFNSNFEKTTCDLSSNDGRAEPTSQTLSPMTQSRARSASCTRGAGEGKYDCSSNPPSVYADNADESHLLNILLRPVANGDENFDGRKYHSLRVNRRRSKNVTDLWERERTSISGERQMSPLLNNETSEDVNRQETAKENTSSTDSSVPALVRNGFARSSCPSRVQSAERQTVKRETLLDSDVRKTADTNQHNVPMRKPQNPSVKIELEKRMSREVAMGAASIEQQIKQLESSLDCFDKDLSLEATVNKHRSYNNQAEAQILRNLPLNPVKQMTRVSVPEDSYGGGTNIKDRMKKLTQLYSGNEVLEVQLKKKPTTYGREIKHSDATKYQKNFYQAHNVQNFEKFHSDNVDINLSFKDEGFDSEGFSNTSASQKSSRSSSRERDPERCDWNGCQAEAIQHHLSFKRENIRPDDSLSTASSNRLFDRSIESLVSKEMTLVNCSNFNSSPSKNNLDQTSNSQKITKSPTSLNHKSSQLLASHTPNRGKAIKNAKVESPLTFGNKISTALNRGASKPASRVTALAETKKTATVKTDSKKTAEKSGNVFSRLSAPSKPRSLSKDSEATPKTTRDHSVKSTHSGLKINSAPSKSSPRSLSVAGTRTPRALSTIGTGDIGGFTRSDKRSSIGSNSSSLSSDTATKFSHVSRDMRPKIMKNSQMISNTHPSSSSHLMTKAMQLTTVTANKQTASSPGRNQKRAPSTSSTNSGTPVKNPNFVRQSIGRSSMPITSHNYSKTLKVKSNETGSIHGKIARPSKPGLFCSLNIAKSVKAVKS